MKSFKRRFSAVEGTAALFFIQIFSTLGFAVLYSTLVLYATKHLHLGVKEATTLMGVFGAFNYGLHLFGGYLGGAPAASVRLHGSVGGHGPILRLCFYTAMTK
jgi:POT family proton-dependent oligopeptide transporter